MADGGTKPLSFAKVKPGARMTAKRQRRALCETDHTLAGDPKRPRSREPIGYVRVICNAGRESSGAAPIIPVIGDATSRLIVAINDDIASG
jgi:hypothetical protein